MTRWIIGAFLIAALASPAVPQSSAPGNAVEIGGANLPALPVGPQDLIAVSVYGAPELSRTVRVSGDEGGGAGSRGVAQRIRPGVAQRSLADQCDVVRHRNALDANA